MRQIDVKKIPVDPGPAGWNSILPARPPAASLKGAEKADWIVIGAGFAGLAAARRLVQIHPSDRIVVLDACRIGEGPAGRNSGFMIDLPHDLSSSDYGGTLDNDIALTTDNRRAISFAENMAQDFGLSHESFAKTGKINGAATDKGHQHNIDYARHLERMGETSILHDAAQMRQITGTDYYQSGLYTSGSALIQPALYVRGVADGLSGLGVAIFENSPVTQLGRDAKNWVANTPEGRVSAPNVILAVNGHLNSFGFAKNRLMHVFTYASMTRKLIPEECAKLSGQKVWSMTPADPMGTTVRRISGIGGDRIVVRNRFTFDPDMQVSDARIARVGQDHDRSFSARFPMLDGVSMQYRWGGRLCVSRNNVSIVRKLETGLFAACCQNGLGTTRGTLSGMLVAEFASGISPKTLDRALTCDAPSLVPSGKLAALGINGYLRWQEYRAGREL